MKTKKNGVSTGLMLVGLLVISNNSFASLSSKLKEYAGESSSNLSSLYIIAGVIAVGVIGKIIQNYFMKEGERTSPNVKISGHSQHRHNHRHHRAVVKKTS